MPEITIHTDAVRRNRYRHHLERLLDGIEEVFGERVSLSGREEDGRIVLSRWWVAWLKREAESARKSIKELGL